MIATRRRHLLGGEQVFHPLRFLSYPDRRHSETGEEEEEEGDRDV